MSVNCQKESCNKSFNTEHGMKIHFGQKHETLRSVTVQCDHCGDKVEKMAKNVNRNKNNFCDNECYGNWRTELTGENNPKYNRIKVRCEFCGSEKHIQENEYNRNDKHFCDKECYFSWTRENIKDNYTYYGNNWNKISSKVRNRDEKCKRCGISNNSCNDRYGCQLHVHHITPLKEFSNKSEANKMENLISLCPSCHMKVEYNDT